MSSRIDEEFRRAVRVLIADPPDLPPLPAVTRPTRPQRRGPTVLALAMLVVLIAVGVPSVIVLSNQRATQGPSLENWRQGAEAPFTPRHGMFSAALDDDRILVWGGVESAFDGGIYDPSNDTWEAIPEAPVGDLSVIGVKVAAGRLAVIGTLEVGGRIAGTVFDVGSGEWLKVPTNPDIATFVDGFAWDGETLAVVRVGGEAEWRVDRPITSRWEYGTTEWSLGAQFPFDVRAGAGVAADSSRIAVWGGVSDDGQVHDDGAIYIVDDDRWDPIPSAPITARVNPEAAWLQSGLAVGGGMESNNPDLSGLDPNGQPYDPGIVPGIALYHVASGTWDMPASPPDDSGFNGPFNALVPSEYYDNGQPQLLVRSTWGGSHPTSGIHAAYWYQEATDEWGWTPMSDLHPADDYLVATTRTVDNPDNDAFAVRLWNGQQWSTAAKGPFTNRMQAAVVVTNDQIVVIGGAQGRQLDATNDTWIIDIEQ